MYIEGKACWLNHLENALQKYSIRKHGTRKMTSKMSTYKKLTYPKNSNSNQNKPSYFKLEIL